MSNSTMVARSTWHPLAAVLVYALLSSCTLPSSSETPETTNAECTVATSCDDVAEFEERVFFDAASNLQNVQGQSNVIVATDDPDGFFWKDEGRFIQSCVSPPCIMCRRCTAVRMFTAAVVAGSKPTLTVRSAEHNHVKLYSTVARLSLTGFEL